MPIPLQLYGRHQRQCVPVDFGTTSNKLNQPRDGRVRGLVDIALVMQLGPVGVLLSQASKGRQALGVAPSGLRFIWVTPRPRGSRPWLFTAAPSGLRISSSHTSAVPAPQSSSATAQ